MGLEDLVFDGLPIVEGITGASVRLIASDEEFKGVRNRYWIVFLSDSRPETPEGYQERILREDSGLILAEWSYQEAVRSTRL